MKELKLIKKFYGDRTAERSKVPLINHIIEGLIVLHVINASMAAIRAYCLHPLLQGDKELIDQFDNVVHEIKDSHVIALAMEYRSVANEFLSGKIGVVVHPDQIRLSPIKDVNDMLIADKVQNRKDFLTYHLSTHPRSAELDLYFKLWMQKLGIDDVKYEHLCAEIDRLRVRL